jgi:hypothetical protein
MGELVKAYKSLVGKPEGKRPLKDLGVDGGTLLQWNFRTSSLRV